MIRPLIINHHSLDYFFSQALNSKISIHSCVADKLGDSVDDSELSRYSLWQLFKTHKLGCRTKAKSVRFPKTKASVCHADNKGFAVVSHDNNVKGIGIDFEPKHQIKPSWLSTFSGKQENAQLHSPTSETATRLWTVKEAAHKANPNNHRIGWLSAYSLSNPNLWLGKVTAKKNYGRDHYYYASKAYTNGILSIVINIA